MTPGTGESVEAAAASRRVRRVVLSLKFWCGGQVWNDGRTALSWDSPISQASTRAVVSVDAQGRRSISMVSLADVGGSAAGNPAYR